MLTLIIIVIFGLIFAFLATQNTVVTTFNVLGYTWTLPMYIIVFGALLIGFFISWIVSSINSLGTWFNVHGKNSKIRESQQTVDKLQGRIRELELENAKLEGRNETPQKEIVKEVIAEKQAKEDRPFSFLDRFRKTPAY